MLSISIRFPQSAPAWIIGDVPNGDCAAPDRARFDAARQDLAVLDAATGRDFDLPVESRSRKLHHALSTCLGPIIFIGCFAKR